MQGFAELEYGMLRYMGAIDDSTPIVTSGNHPPIPTMNIHFLYQEVHKSQLTACNKYSSVMQTTLQSWLINIED